MASKQQMTGMLGVYLTAVELTKQGFIVSPTSRSAAGADLLVTDQECKQAFSVQVKTNAANRSFWVLGEKTKETTSASHIYVFVNAPAGREPTFFVVLSKNVAKRMRSNRKSSSFRHWFNRDEADQDNWKVFGNPEGPIPAPVRPPISN